MKYDFTSIIDRHDKDAIAVDIPQGSSMNLPKRMPKDGLDQIPMWVADMNFPTVPTVQEAIIERVKHPAFGYFSPRDEYYNEIIHWHQAKNHVEGMTRECIGYENGVLGGVASVIQAYTAPGDAILLHSPTYIGFTHAIENLGRKIVLSELKKDDQGIYRMDYEDMDRKIREFHIRVAVFCTPHNPTGRVWTREELEKAYEVYRRNDCIVITDEIWSDIILNSNEHIIPQTLNEDAKMRTVALYAPSKTFNLAGLIGSYHVIYNEKLRQHVVNVGSKAHYNDMNVLSMYALIGAYKPEGEVWVEELRQVLSDNVNYACEFIQKNFQGVEVTKPEGTYMLFLDCEKWCKAHNKELQELLEAGWDAGVIWQDGRPFHGVYGIRMNLALPYSRVKEAFERLQKYVFKG